MSEENKQKPDLDELAEKILKNVKEAKKDPLGREQKRFERDCKVEPFVPEPNKGPPADE